jgi:hypothetical protein
MLWVVTCYFNFKNDPRRLINLRRFVQGLPEEAKLCVVSLSHPSQEPLTVDEAQMHVVVQTERADMWCKEALLNVGMRNLPLDCDKVCWMDADVEIPQPGWWGELDALLDTHPVAQPHSEHVFMEEGETPQSAFPLERRHKSFAHQADKRARSGFSAVPVHFLRYHPGYAWAARIDFLKSVDYLFPYCILGHGDLVMCAAFSGHYPTVRHLWNSKRHKLDVYTAGWSKALKEAAWSWQIKVEQAMLGKTIGVLQNTTLFHWFHGTNESRKYAERGKLLAEYNPHKDTRVNSRGMIEWTDEADPRLVAAVSKYFDDRARSDSTVIGAGDLCCTNVEDVGDVLGGPDDHECSFKKECCLVGDTRALALYYDAHKDALRANEDAYKSFVHYIVMGVDEATIDVCAWRTLVQRVCHDDEVAFRRVLEHTFHTYSDGIEDLYHLEAMWKLSEIVPMIEVVLEAQRDKDM